MSPGAQPGSQCPRIVCYYPKGIQRGTSKHNQLLISDSVLLQLKVIILKPIGAQYLGVVIYITKLCQREKKAIVEITTKHILKNINIGCFIRISSWVFYMKFHPYVCSYNGIYYYKWREKIYWNSTPCFFIHHCRALSVERNFMKFKSKNKFTDDSHMIYKFSYPTQWLLRGLFSPDICMAY